MDRSTPKDSVTDSVENFEETKDEEKSDEDTEKPTSLAYARRIIESPHYDGRLDPNFRPSLFDASRINLKSIGRGPAYAKKETLKVIAQICEIYNETKAVGKSTDISYAAKQLGYRFPMSCFTSTQDRTEIRDLGKRMIMENQTKKPQLWVYFYPSTDSLPHNLHYEFLSELFPEESDRDFIENVGEDKDTSMLCLAVQDSFYIKETTSDLNRNNVICMVSFKCLQESHLKEERGCYVYYIGTLQGLSFHEVSPTNGNMQDLKGPLTSNGLAEWLLRLTQIFAANVTKSPYMFLVTNPTISIRGYYEKLDFKEVKSWNIVGKEVLDCARLESERTTDLIPLRISKYMSPQEYTTQELIMKTCRNLPRFMKETAEKNAPINYRKK